MLFLRQQKIKQMNEAELLFTEILNCDRASLYLRRDLRLDQDKSYFISSTLKRRILGEPIQYILGKTEFMGLEFRLTPDVFIPRPETEILVEAALKYVTHQPSPVTSKKILDVGTGSGNIAISLAKFLPQTEIFATDISKKTLEIASLNAKLNKVSEKIKFIQSDLFTDYPCLPARQGQAGITDYDIIVSNPPYIITAEIDNLQPEISYEPRIAVDGGKDGLDFYRRIIADSASYLKLGGFLIMEMGFNQKEAIEDILQKSGNYKIIDAVRDYNNIERVLVAKRYG
jgi:release factor glutamine methyltransferase